VPVSRLTRMTMPDEERTVRVRPEPASPLPQQLGKYPLTELIGPGSLGVLYRSQDPDSQRELALEVIRLPLLQDAANQSVAQFRSAIEIGMRLSHPGILSIRGYGEEAGFAYIATDWTRGGSLLERLERNPHFGLEQVVDIQSQLLQALQYMHERGLCHQTLKPANILLTTNGRVRIAGAGLIHPGGLVGTSAYSAPESGTTDALDQRSDVYAAGAVFYELLTGVPFAGETPDQKPLPPSKLARQPVLEPFDAVALQALARDPHDRLPSAAHFLENLLESYIWAGDTAHQSKLADVPSAVPATADAHSIDSPTIRSPAAESPPTRLLARPYVEPATQPEMPIEASSELLVRIERRLMQSLGPIAAIMVRRAARETTDTASLIDWLAARIDELSERERFLHDVGRMNIGAPSPVDAPTRWQSEPAPIGPAPPTAEDIARAAQLLVSRLGPIAPVLARRTAQQAGCSREQFIATLATHLTDERERAQFVTAWESVRPL
jgi:eukaryotic-like serine/threonine-protein kinase